MLTAQFILLALAASPGLHCVRREGDRANGRVPPRREEAPLLEDRAVRVAVALRESQGRWLLPDVFGREMGLDPAALRETLRQARQAGYRVEVRPGGLFRLVAGPDRLDAREIQHGLRTSTIGRQVEVRAEVASTMDLAWSATRLQRSPQEVSKIGGQHETLTGSCPLRKPVCCPPIFWADGWCVFAEHQTAGRGRQGRPWSAPPRSSILMSMAVQAPLTIDQAPSLTFAASVAVAEAVRAATGCACTIEWPNDIMVNERKVAGILVEGRAAPTNMRQKIGGQHETLTGSCPLRKPVCCPPIFWRLFVIGVGLNANLPSAALPEEVREQATSLAAECGRPVDRVLLARRLLTALDTWHAVLVRGDLELVQRRWLELAGTVGRRVVLAHRGREVDGVVVDVSPTDGLALRLAHGEIRHFQPQGTTVIGRGNR